MSRFTGPLSVTHLSSRGHKARLNEPLFYELGSEGSGKTIEIPKGFVSDGTSVPRAFWWYVPPWGHGATRASLVHDYLLKKLSEGETVFHIDTRRKADLEFYYALQAADIGPVMRYIMFLAVRANSILRHGF